VKAFFKVEDFNCLNDKYNPMFNILKHSYDQLLFVDQSLFVDIVVFKFNGFGKSDVILWLNCVYNQ
jgi:hypothetical protein